MSTSNKVKTLLQWCAANSIFIDPRIQVRQQEDAERHADIGVFSTESFIPPDTTVVRIPKEAILSVRTCSLANCIPVVSHGIGAQLSLSLALYVEILKHNRSRWHGYIQSLSNEVDLPLFWEKKFESTGSGEACDCAEALLWLTGTEAAKVLDSKTENGSSILVEIDKFFNDVAQPLLRTHSEVWLEANSCQQPTIEGFYHAFSLVSSRAFLVDTYHGLSIVPIADAFNHSVENHVHLESDYLVCPECGSLRECAHDVDEPRGSNFSVSVDHEHDNCYEMVSNTGIAPNSEVFNTFGETLTNSQLLNQYGFVLDVNENDRLLWSAQELFDSYAETTDETVKAAILKTGDVLLGSLLDLPHFFDQSQLVCHEPDVEHRLYVNDEGMISAGLWTLLTAFTASGLQITDTVIEQLTEIVDVQLRMESFSGETAEESSPASDIVLQTARSVVKLCDRRKRKSGKPASFDCNLSDLLGDIPQSHRRTQLAISILLTERSILDACHAEWSSLIDGQCLS